MAHIYLDGVLNALRKTNAAFSIETQPGVSPSEVLVLSGEDYLANVVGRAIYPAEVGKPKIHWYLESEGNEFGTVDLTPLITPKYLEQKEKGVLSYYTEVPWNKVLKILIHGVDSGDNTIVNDNIEIAEKIMNVISLSKKSQAASGLRDILAFLEGGGDTLKSENICYLTSLYSGRTYCAYPLESLPGGGFYQLISQTERIPLLLAMVANFDITHRHMVPIISWKGVC